MHLYKEFLFLAVIVCLVQAKAIEKRGLNQDELMRDFNQIFPNIDAAKNFGDRLVNSVRDQVNAISADIETRVVEPVEQSRELVRRMRDSWTTWFNNAYEQFREVVINIYLKKN